MHPNDRDGHHQIETARLVLRHPQLSDARQFAVLGNNWAVSSKLSRMPHPYREADAIEWIERLRADGTEPAFAVMLAETGDVIGACGIGPTT